MIKNNNKYRVLVAAENYPGNPNGKNVSHQFVHVRNASYKASGVDVTVLNFSSENDYMFEGLPVICPRTYTEQKGQFDVLIFHQPNLKHAVPFCLKNSDDFKSFIFFFHGHEVLKLSVSYSKPYSYCKDNYLAVKMRDVYDDIKFVVLRQFFSKVKAKSHFVFVSGWMYDEFKKWLKVDDSFLGNRARIIPNCIADEFENNSYDCRCEKTYDFITVRGNLDTSKYAVDLVIETARSNPDYSFLVVGKGRIFEHFGKPENLFWLDMTLSHSEITRYLNEARFALMPTRTDAQGLMMCEMASFGIPLITSDISVCREVMAGFDNVALVSNDSFAKDAITASKKLFPKSGSFSPFSKRNTIEREIRLIDEAIEERAEC